LEEDKMADINELLEKQTELLGELVKKTAGNAQDAPQLHGNGGLFSNALERDVITAYVRPKGIGSALDMMPSTVEDPRFGSITGYTATTGDEPTTVCDDAPHGFVKGCNLTARFGLLRRDTNTIDIDKVMLKKNRGDFNDLILRGRVLGMNNMVPTGLNEAQILNILTMSEMVGAAVQAERKLSQTIWRGTLADGGTPGLDLQIATGQMDADTSTLCPALDSDVKDFNYDAVDGNGRDIVEYMSMMAFYLQYNAEGMGLDPTEWLVAMRPELWSELSATWPCRYMTNRCTNLAGTNVAVINDNVNIATRDAMRRSMTIDINGRTYPVVTDTGIFEHNNINNAHLAAGEYASSIYFVPLRIQSNFPATYREYVDYRGWDRDVSLLRNMQTFWTDDGIYSWAIEFNKWCYKLALKTEQRVVLRTPQLAGKIQRVKYVPLQHLREPYADSPYFADGGVSVRGSSWGKAVWA